MGIARFAALTLLSKSVLLFDTAGNHWATDLDCSNVEYSLQSLNLADRVGIVVVMT